jgi:hypothetical protein
MFPFVLALSALQPQPLLGDIQPANRDAVQAALSRGQTAVDRIGHCAMLGSAPDGAEHHYDALLDILRDVSDAAQDLYPDIDPISEAITQTMGARAPRCDRASVRAYDAQARQVFGEVRALVEADGTQRRHGLWLGNLRLCGGRVEAIGEEGPEFAGDSRRVTVRFSTAFAPRVRALTEAFVNRRLPVILDGTILVRATVMEPIAWSISIAAPEALPTDRLRRAAAAPC